MSKPRWRWAARAPKNWRGPFLLERAVFTHKPVIGLSKWGHTWFPTGGMVDIRGPAWMRKRFGRDLRPGEIRRLP
ncbi:MAG TPA: hypothetical protein VM695_10090 [Phycisphaerae bacterium]|nr:hypothetical protein [Phycisphaerae bacterium]